MTLELLIRHLGKTLRKPYYAAWRSIERFAYWGREYTLQVPFGHLVYSPWFAPNSEFAKFIAKVKQSGPLIVSLDRCYMIYQFCKYAIALDGDIVECGTYTGGTAYLLASVMKARVHDNRRLHLFDTFQGMPDIAVPERDAHAPGDFGDTCLDYVRRRLQGFPFVEFHPGFIPDTFAEITNLDHFSFIHVDVDIYPTALECCRWFWPRLTRGGVILFDDYGFRSYRHAMRAAVDDFFATTKDEPLVLPTGQAVAIKGGDGIL